jgi:hypothetical protein
MVQKSFAEMSGRRSGNGGRRKNQTKTMSPFVRRGDIHNYAKSN